MDGGERFEIRSELWKWQPADQTAGGWCFVNVDARTATEIRYAALGRASRFGSIRVTATIGETSWKTSLFPHKETGGFLLPVKADVRRRERLEVGQDIIVGLDV